MTVTQTKHSSNSIASALKTNGFRQLLAVGSIAMGVTATISAAPAGAVDLRGGGLNFTGATNDFFFAPAAIPTSFSVDFLAPTTVTVANGAFITPTPVVPVGSYSVAPFTANFDRTVPIDPFDILGFKLRDDLVFNFNNGTTLTLKATSGFSGLYNRNATTNVIESLTMSLTSNAGSFYTNGTDVTNTETLGFSFNDSVAPSSGGTSGVVSTTKAVPEPFTIIGTLVGGTAAFRMRKKLAAANK